MVQGYRLVTRLIVLLVIAPRRLLSHSEASAELPSPSQTLTEAMIFMASSLQDDRNFGE
jgi:hypothetical protein